MDALDVLSLEDAKAYLKVDFDDDDDLIESLIKAAVSLVEKTTEYRLYKRNEVIQTSKIGYTAFQFPLNGASVEAMDSQGTYTIQTRYETLRTLLFWGNGYWYTSYEDQFFNPNTYGLSGCVTNYTLTLDVGYADTADVPTDLLTAIKQIITFTYENRNESKLELPSNISMLMAPYRRFATLL